MIVCGTCGVPGKHVGDWCESGLHRGSCGGTMVEVIPADRVKRIPLANPEPALELTTTALTRVKSEGLAACCWKCSPEFPGMLLCPTCGNKRCPHASDHTLACTSSNEPGQTGSVYSRKKPHS